jgi:branched-chain amino acid transport system substrate-binding protein
MCSEGKMRPFRAWIIRSSASGGFGMIERSSFLTSLAAVGAVGAVPGVASAAPASGTPYKIGVTFPLSGPLATLITNARGGPELAVEQINAAGGVNGHPLELVYEDTQGTPEGGIAAMRKLVQVNGVQAVLTIFTNVVTAQMPLADALKVPTMSTVESPGLVTKSQFSFAHTQTINTEAPLLAKYWKAAGYKKLYAFIGNNAYGQLIEPTVKKVANDLGMEYAESFIDLNQTDYRGVIAKARDFNPDMVFVSAQGSSAETAVIRQIRELDITAPIYDPGNYFYDRSWRAAVGPYVNGMYFVGLNMDSRINPAFVEAFKKKNGQSPTYIAAELYDIIKIYAYAIGKVGYNGVAIRDVIANLNGLPSVFGGKIQMGADHYSISSTMDVWNVRGGELLHALPVKATH